MKESSGIHSDAAHWDLVQRYVDDQATATDIADLECLLLADPEFRAAFLDYLSIDSALGDTVLPGVKNKTQGPALLKRRQWTSLPLIVLASAAAIALLAVVTGILPNPFRSSTSNIASIGAVSDDVRWMSAPQTEGSSLDSGLILIDLGPKFRFRKSTPTPGTAISRTPTCAAALSSATPSGAAAQKNPIQPDAENNAGWTRIARVNTDAFFGVREQPDRPPQQASSIFSGGKNAIGSFRYLLFEVTPTPMPDGMRPRHTFFGEIDIFTYTPQP